MGIQESRGDFSPNINGSNNQTNTGNTNVKIRLMDKVRYSIIGFVIGVATSFIGSYLYDWYKSKSETKENAIEVPLDNKVIPSKDSVETGKL